MSAPAFQTSAFVTTEALDTLDKQIVEARLGDYFTATVLMKVTSQGHSLDSENWQTDHVNLDIIRFRDVRRS